MTQTILDRCRSIAPDLLNEQGDFKVLRVEVGLRPSRHSGPRVEIEVLNRGGQGQGGVKLPFICHNYGHHSSGSVGQRSEVAPCTDRDLGLNTLLVLPAKLLTWYFVTSRLPFLSGEQARV